MKHTFDLAVVKPQRMNKAMCPLNHGLVAVVQSVYGTAAVLIDLSMMSQLG